jgi:hypothetical protein
MQDCRYAEDGGMRVKMKEKDEYEVTVGRFAVLGSGPYRIALVTQP